MQYDPGVIERHYKQHPRQIWKRSLAIARTFSHFGLSLGWDWLSRRLLQNQPRRACQLRQTLAQLGPTFIKLGQMLSCRPDLIPPAYLTELANLQDRLSPFPTATAHQLIEQELGRSYDQVYAELSVEPVAAASLGQVYKGKLKIGETVAVKVQRPGLMADVISDLFLLRHLAAWIQNHISIVYSDLVAIVDELATRLFEEMDYICEGRNAQRFARLYGDIPGIYVPRIYWQYTRRRVLTMEWIDGTKLTQVETSRDQGWDGASLVELGFRCSLRQLLEAGFFHADPHPGNLLATTDGKLAYLDFGMMSQVDPYYRDRILESIIHILTGDFEALAQDYVNLEFLPPETDTVALTPALATVFDNAANTNVSEFGFKSIIEQLTPLIYKYPFRLPTYYLLIFRSFAALEGLALNINPQFQPFAHSYPYIAQRLLTDPSPSLRTCLQHLVFKDGAIRWQLLENLVHQACTTEDWDRSNLLRQGLDFLYSEQGQDLRTLLVAEIATQLADFPERTFKQISQVLGWTTATTPRTPERSTLSQLRMLWNTAIAASGSRVDAASQLVGLILRAETQALGHQVANEWGKRLIAQVLPQ